MDTVTLGTFQIIDIVDTENTVVSEVVLCLNSEECFASDRQLLLEADQGADVLMVGTNMVQEGDNTLAVHSGLNAKVAEVESMLSKPTVIDNRKINLGRTR